MSPQSAAKRIPDSTAVSFAAATKAIYLGVHAVASANCKGWGLAATGQAGLVRAVEILKSESIITTRLGNTRLDQLTAAYLDKLQPSAPPYEMSALPHMPGGRCCKRVVGVARVKSL